MNRFVVSVRREKRSPAVTADLVRENPGVTVLETSRRGRLIITAEPAVVLEVRRQFGSLLIIEPEILHGTL